MSRWRAYLIAAVVTGVFLLSGLHPWLREALIDARFRLLTRASGGIVLVEIDPHAIETVGSWPWPRSLHARLVGQLQKAGASEIAFDVDFSTSSTSEQDSAFAAALREAGGSVILPAFRQRVADRGDGRTVHVNRPLPLFVEHAWLGLVNVAPESDGVIRRYVYGAPIDGAFVPSIGALLAGRHDDASGPFRIDFGIRPLSVPSLSAADVLQNAEAVRGKVEGRKVIVSGTAAELGDRFTVPNGRVIPGSLVQALAAESLLQGRALSTTSLPAALGGLVVLGLLTLPLRRLRASRRIVALVALAFGVEATAWLLQAFQPVAADTAHLLVAIAAFGCAAMADEIDLRGILRHVAERRFEQVAMSLGDGLVCTDRSGAITMWNPGATAIFGYERPEVLGRPFAFLLAEADTEPFSPVHQPVGELRQAGGLIVDLVGRRRNGGHFALECSLSCWDSTDGVQYGAILRDVSEQRRQQEHMRYLAECDSVTGLPNRASLLQNLAQRGLVEGAPDFAVILVSVTRLEQINGLHGHAFGDCLVLAVAHRLRREAPDSAILARIASDSFALVHACGRDEAEALSARLIAAFQAEPLPLGDRDYRAGVSVGYGLSGDARRAEELLGNAHFALAAAKTLGSTAPVAFVAGMRKAVETREALEAELRQALVRDEFELFYQPQMDLRSRAVIGAETLIRWRHGERGLIAPGDFLHVVNASSLAEAVSTWVLRQACRQAAAWERKGSPLRVAVNLTQSQFTAGNLASEVAELLRETGLSPHLLELEVTEDIILDHSDGILRMLASLRALGVKIAFDDFGTGYGSLTYLKAFPLDTIKIDQSFVRRLGDTGADVAIVEATINLGHALGLSVIAEGIETEDTIALLQRLGCDEGQGFLIAKPLPVDEFERRFLGKGARQVA